MDQIELSHHLPIADTHAHTQHTKKHEWRKAHGTTMNYHNFDDDDDDDDDDHDDDCVLHGEAAGPCSCVQDISPRYLAGHHWQQHCTRAARQKNE